MEKNNSTKPDIFDEILETPEAQKARQKIEEEIEAKLEEDEEEASEDEGKEEDEIDEEESKEDEEEDKEASEERIEENEKVDEEEELEEEDEDEEESEEGIEESEEDVDEEEDENKEEQGEDEEESEGIDEEEIEENEKEENESDKVSDKLGEVKEDELSNEGIGELEGEKAVTGLDSVGAENLVKRVESKIDLEAKKISDDEKQLVSEEQKINDLKKEINEVEKEVVKSSGSVKLNKNDLKAAIIKKALMVSKNERETPFTGAEKLCFLSNEDKSKVFIGRKKSIFKKYGFEAGLYLGKVKESEFHSSEVYLDSLNPHVVFVCGARGSGKSYVLGVIAEELAKKNKDVGIIAVDPIGVFWSMKYPNKEENEVNKLLEWGLEPEGLNNLKVFIPVGASENTPKSTYNDVFSMQPSLLTGEDWCLTFGIDRFSVTGLLLEKALEKVEKGYTQMDVKEGEETIKGKKVKGKKKNYALNDIIECLTTDSEINSRDKGYKPDSIRALVSRFEAAKTWGIFSQNGTPLSKLSRANQLTVLDTSFLDDNVTALVIGVLARRILAARKISTRKEASQKFKELNVEQLLETDIPPTWLFIDEAHTLIPGGNEKTAATTALVEYVKQGRRPGCSLVFATQQPSAIDTKVLSQLDTILVHKLVFDDDIKAVYKRTPTLIPNRYRKATFIKTLPVGIALTGDRREETSRMFVLEVRPRMSQHEGRDAETGESNLTLTQKQLREMATKLLLKTLNENKAMSLEKAREIIEILNSKYNGSLEFEKILKELKKQGVSNNEEKLFLGKEPPSEEEDKEETSDEEESEEDEEEIEEEEEESDEVEEPVETKLKENIQSLKTIDLRALPLKIDKKTAVRIASKLKKNKILGLLGSSEEITSRNLKYSTIHEIEFASKNNLGEFILHKCYLDANSGEFIHFKNNEFVKSKGFKELIGLSKDEINIIKILLTGKTELNDLFEKTNLNEDRGKRLLTILYQKGFIGTIKDEKNKNQFFFLKTKMDLPINPTNPIIESISKMPFVEVEAIQKEFENYSREKLLKTLEKFWTNIVIKKTAEILKPKWIITLNHKGFERKLNLDGYTGKVIE